MCCGGMRGKALGGFMMSRADEAEGATWKGKTKRGIEWGEA